MDADLEQLDGEFVMHLSSHAYASVLWAFATALAKVHPEPERLRGALLPALDAIPLPGEPDAGTRVWQKLIESHANELLAALDRGEPPRE